MPNNIVRVLHGTVLDDASDLTLEQLCRICRLQSDFVVTLIEEGILDPEGENPATWRFPGVSVSRVRIAVRLQRDLELNLAGVALVLDLLERLSR